MIILDASTLILLAKINILKEAIEDREVLITKEVQLESTSRSELFDAKIIIELIKSHKIEVVEVKNRILLDKFKKDFVIAPGEASALLLAYQKQAVLATDDYQAIKASKIMGIKFVTAIHFLLDVYRRKKIGRELALAKLEHLKKLGRYNAGIISDAINRIQEEK